MSTLKKRLSFEEHQRIAAELSSIHAFLTKLYCRVAGTYGKTDRAGRIAFKALDNIDYLRSEMEAHFYRDCPREARDGPTFIYYPRDTEQWTVDMRLPSRHPDPPPCPTAPQS